MDLGKKGLILVFCTAIISGFSIFLNKHAVTGMNPYVFTFLKNVIVALALVSLLIFFMELKTLKTLTKKQWLQLSVIGVFGGGIPFLLFFKGLTLTNAAMGSFIQKTMFLYVALFAVIFLKEKLKRTVFISALLLLVGSLLLLKLTQFSFGFGDILILTATLFWAFENTLSKHVLKKLSGTIVAAARMFFGSIFILIFLAITNQLSLVSTISSAQLGWIFFTALLLLGYVLTWYNGLKHVNVTTATAILLIGSPITTLLNFFFAHKVMGVVEVLGIISIFAGIGLLLFTKNQTTLSTAYP